MPKPPGLDRVIAVLGTADAVAHLAFLDLRVARFFRAGRCGRVFAIAWTVLAALGLASAIIGRFIIKYGGPAKKIGVWAVGASTALAGVLLVIAASTS